MPEQHEPQQPERSPEQGPAPSPDASQTPAQPEGGAAPSGAGEAQKSSGHMGQFRARPASVSDKPRRVRAGRKLNTDDWPQRLGWAGTRWIEAIRSRVPEQVWKEGLDYAERGQTRRLETLVGGVNADVQGRPYRPYTTEILLRPFEHEKWDEAVRELVRSSIHAARLLSGEMPEAIQDEIFAPLGLNLLPEGVSAGGIDEVRCVCNCREAGAWCKHAVCVAMLLAEDIDADPFLLFRLRGLEGEDLLEKLRQRRELENTGGTRPASALRLPFPGDETPAPAMETCIDAFWEAPRDLEDIETTPRRPEVAHALLRRLGPTPFEGARFPLSGLLATCYDTFTRDALREQAPMSSEAGANEPAVVPASEESSKGPQLSAAARLLRAKVAGKAGAKASAKARKPGG
ncbi:MAG: hypothetical protein Tsb0013_19090 [Phycisphaerales bacterium]